MSYDTEEIRHAYKSNHNLKRENQVILLMITDGKKWHYLTVNNIHKKSSKTKINKHTPFGYSLFTRYSFDGTKNKLDCYRGKDLWNEFDDTINK